MVEQVWPAGKGLVALLGSLASLLGSRVQLASVGCTALLKGLILSASETGIGGEGGGGVGGGGIGGEGESFWGRRRRMRRTKRRTVVLSWAYCSWRRWWGGGRMKERVVVGLCSWMVWRGGSNPDVSAGGRLLCGGESCSWGGGRVRGRR